MITPWDYVPVAEQPIHHPISSDLADRFVGRTTLVTILERVRDELQHGKAIGDLMRDPWWQQVFETGEFPKPRPRAPVEPPWSSLPMPTSMQGRDVRQKLQQALVAADAKMARWAQAMGEQLRPEEREIAVNAVLRMWHQYRLEPQNSKDIRPGHNGHGH